MIPKLLAFCGVGLSLWFTTETLQTVLPDTAPIALLLFSTFLQLAQYYYSKPGKWWLMSTVGLLYCLSIFTSYLFLMGSVSAALNDAKNSENAVIEQRKVINALEEEAALERQIINELNASGYKSKAFALLQESTVTERLNAAIIDLDQVPASTGLGVMPEWGVNIGVFLLALVLELVICMSLIESRQKIRSNTARIEQGEENSIDPVGVHRVEEKQPEKPKNTLPVDPLNLIKLWPDQEPVNVATLRERCGCSEREGRAAIAEAKKQGWLIRGDGNRWLRKSGPRAIIGEKNAKFT